MKKILLIRFSALGDLVAFEPTFRAIRYFFKNSEISLLTSSVGKSLYSDSLPFNNIYIHESFLATLKKLKKEKFDIVINLQCNKPSHLITMMIKNDILINKSFSFWGKIFNIKTKSKSVKEILQECKINYDDLNKYFNISKNSIIQLPFYESKYKLKEKFDKKIIAISTGASKRWKSKKWGIENYMDLIEKLIKHNFQIILVGTALEVSDSEKIQNIFGHRIFNLVNKTTLTELKNILSEIDLFIGNDSGPVHIAAAVGTKTLTIFGPTDIRHCVKFMPYQNDHLWIKPKSNISCHPCYKTTCPTKMECMHSIKSEKVFNIVLNILGTKKK